MYAIVMQTTLKPGTRDHVAQVFTESIGPAAKHVDGFVRGFFHVDPESGQCLSMSHWQKREHALHVIESGFFKDQVAKIADCFAEPPKRYLFEVTSATEA